MFDDTFESQYFRSAIGYRKHIDTKGILQSGLFYKSMLIRLSTSASRFTSITMRMPSLED